MRRTPRSRPPAALALLALLSCGAGPSRLVGSVSSQASLGFDEVRAEWLLDQLAIRFVSVGATLRSDAARLTLSERRALVDVEVDAAADVTVEHFRYDWDDQGRLVTEPPFPVVERGILRFSKVGRKLGDRVIGEFSIVFVTGDTLNGEFDAEVVPVDPNR